MQTQADVRSPQCAATGGAEMVRKGASQFEPIPATASNPQHFPANPDNFRGSFH